MLIVVWRCFLGTVHCYRCQGVPSTHFRPEFQIGPVTEAFDARLANRPFLAVDIRALWRSGLNTSVPESQKLKISPVRGLTVDSSQLTFVPTSKSRDTKTRSNIKNPA